MAFVFVALTFLLMWVLFILPQQRRVRAHQALVASLQAGDDVMTTAGLFGTITALDDDAVLLQIADGVTVRFARGAIARRVGDEPEPEPEAEPERDVHDEGASRDGPPAPPPSLDKDAAAGDGVSSEQ